MMPGKISNVFACPYIERCHGKREPGVVGVRFGDDSYPCDRYTPAGRLLYQLGPRLEPCVVIRLVCQESPERFMLVRFGVGVEHFEMKRFPLAGPE